MSTVTVNLGALRQPFRPCDPDFIRDVCQARCCRSTVDPTGIAVVVTKREAVALRLRGATVDDETGRVGPVDRRCPFQHGGDHLCTLHGTPDKPVGCIVSPFTVNTKGTLIVRNRYRMLPCFKAEGAVPVALAHRASLAAIFGLPMANAICRMVAAGETRTLRIGGVDDELLADLRHKNEASKAPGP